MIDHEATDTGVSRLPSGNVMVSIFHDGAVTSFRLDPDLLRQLQYQIMRETTRPNRGPR